MNAYKFIILTLSTVLFYVCYRLSTLSSELDRVFQLQEAENGEYAVSSNSSTIGANSTDRLSTPPLKSSTEYYSWTGDHWIPPPGIPTYAADDFLAYFRTRNTLFIGDSTSRRAYATLFAAMNAGDTSNVKRISMDDASVLDVNKRPETPYQERCELSDRKFNASSFLCRNLPDGQSENKQPQQQQTGKFDFIRMNCLLEIYDFFKRKSNIEGYLADYDLVVLSSSIWDILPDMNCGRMYMNSSDQKNSKPEEYITKILDTLKDVSSSKLQIAVRTSGFYADLHHKKVDDLNKAMLHFFGELEKNLSPSELRGSKNAYNMVLVDWGSVIRMRSHHSDRIVGDIDAHYGLEARLLFCQQLLHQLRLADNSKQ